ncbi:MAG: hypothetical protein PVJ67_01365 [Candidatus Pacearchaeota archaeon]|jgi:hypothetical protein
MKKEKKRGQMKIQQMTFMLIAVTLFFVLVGMFLLVISFSGIKKSATELCEKNAVLLATKLANSPEFSCGEAFGGTRVNCIDTDKVLILKDSMKEYKGFWDVTNIEIRKIYPEDKDRECDRGNYPDCNVIKVSEDEGEGVYVSNFVSLCRKETYEGRSYDKCEVGKIMIKYNYGEEC